MMGVFAIAIFVGAALLFLVQPMTARAVLPVLGGGASVWTTCMLFFQVVLVGGYLYAHVLTTRVRGRWQVVVHAAVLAGAVVASLAVRGVGGGPAPGAWPVPWLIGALAVLVGPGFFALSTAGPLLQRWFSRTGHARAGEPYFLYAASNAGSLLGLLAYPFVIEPALALGSQRSLWVGGMVVFAVVALVGGAVAARGAGGPERAEPEAAPVAWADRRRQWGAWAFRAFVPSSLMLGVTSHVSQDIAAFPLLWVVPLAIYLLSFVVAFGRFGGWVRARFDRPAVLALVAVVLAYGAASHGLHPPPGALLVLNLGAFAVVATWCHAGLAGSAPAPARLTEYYLVIAVGGALGGVFNALVAPQVFVIPLEFGVVLALAGLLLPRGGGGRWMLAIPVAVVAVGWGVSAWWPEDSGEAWRRAVLIAPAGILALIASGRRVVFALTLGAVVVSGAAARVSDGSLLAVERSFFGTSVVKSVSVNDGEHALHRLIHGTTVHGMQVASPIDELRRLPLGYYTREGPAGDVFDAVAGRRPSRRVGVVGLGAGTLAAYLRPGERMTFYEIDPVVVRLASDPGLFTYLAETEGEARVVVGDGRRSLAHAGPETRYDLIVLDAFSSDSIPVHLLTREAFGLYFDRLAPGGVVLVHVSNRYMTLEPVVAAVAGSLGAACEGREHRPGEEDVELATLPSTWVVVTPPGGERLRLPPSWTPSAVPAGTPVWTDAYSDLVSVIEWWR